jgi:hypothetical protein
VVAAFVKSGPVVPQATIHSPSTKLRYSNEVRLTGLRHVRCQPLGHRRFPTPALRQGGLARAELRPRRSRYCGDGQRVANHVNEVAAWPCEMIDIDRTNARQRACEEGRIAHATALGFARYR